MTRVSLAVLLGLLATEAKARGGSCSSGACTVTAIGVLLLLLLVFFASLYSSIRKHGSIKGILTNRAAQVIFGYIGILVVAAGGSIAAVELWGNHAVPWYLGSVVTAAFIATRFVRSSPPTPTSAPKPPSVTE